MIQQLYKKMSGACGLCPRACGVVRKTGKKGFCNAGDKIILASACLHYGEEPPLCGRNGSGTMFFSRCNLGCAFCQNYQISHEGAGREITSKECAQIMLKLQDRGARNINLVTGTAYIPLILKAIRIAKKQINKNKLTIPVLWNSSGYETEKSILRIDKFMDFYLPDLKTLNADYALSWFNAQDYPEAASRAIQKMLELKPNKVIIRHLVIPGYLDSTRAVLEWFAKNAADRAALSLMTQYTPLNSEYFLQASSQNAAYPLPRRFISNDEYKTVLSWLEELKIEDGYYQELENNSDWLPDFHLHNPFSSSLSKPVWHWNS